MNGIDENNIDLASPQDVLNRILSGAGPGGGGQVSADSRYADQEIAKIDVVTASGETRRVAYFRLRLVPDLSRRGTARVRLVDPNERLDHIAADVLKSSTAYWKLCDANGIMRPLDFPGSTIHALRVALPAGVPEASPPT